MLDKRQTRHYWALVILIGYITIFELDFNGVECIFIGFIVASFSHWLVLKLVPPLDPPEEETKDYL